MLKFILPSFFALTLLIAPSLSAQTLINDGDEEPVFVVVEDNAIPWLYKTHCLETPSSQKHSCYMEQLAIWLTENVQYPDEATRNKTEGMVIAQFVINTQGAVQDVVIVQDIGDGCGSAAKKVIESTGGTVC